MYHKFITTVQAPFQQSFTGYYYWHINLDLPSIQVLYRGTIYVLPLAQPATQINSWKPNRQRTCYIAATRVTPPTQ